MGGPNAPIAVSASIPGMRRVIDKLAPTDNGTYWTFEGEQLP